MRIVLFRFGKVKSCFDGSCWELVSVSRRWQSDRLIPKRTAIVDVIRALTLAPHRFGGLHNATRGP